MNTAESGTIAIVGAGRLGSALARALSAAGATVRGPLGRGILGGVGSADTVLLCVPDREVHSVAASVPAGPLVGHCAGSLTLSAIAPHEGFSLHPLMTVTDATTTFRGAAAAIAGTTPRALEQARTLARLVGLETVEIDEADRALYHAAASMASNFLVTLETAAEQLGTAVGLERRHLVPLARAALENWAANGGPAALTGPLVRGDEETARRQRVAVELRARELLPLWDALSDATRALARDASVERQGSPSTPRP